MAEQNPTPQEQNPQAPNYDEIFSKLDAILDKRADGLAKSALKDNGIEESEISDIVKAYREQKQARADKQTEDLTTAQNRIAELEKQISDKAIDEALSSAALELGVEAKQLPYVSRLASRDILGSDGQPDAEKVKAAITKVLEDVPALKASANANKGFQPVGSKAGEDSAGSGEDAEKKLRSYFGLK